jgi:hypothetical protein
MFTDHLPSVQWRSIADNLFVSIAEAKAPDNWRNNRPILVKPFDEDSVVPLSIAVKANPSQLCDKEGNRPEFSVSDFTGELLLQFTPGK